MSLKAPVGVFCMALSIVFGISFFAWLLFGHINLASLIPCLGFGAVGLKLLDSDGETWRHW